MIFILGNTQIFIIIAENTFSMLLNISIAINPYYGIHFALHDTDAGVGP
jgi:hypothetical protein